MSCPLESCRTCTACKHPCTACKHLNHAGCRKTVWCPDDRVHRVCACCGDEKEES